MIFYFISTEPTFEGAKIAREWHGPLDTAFSSKSLEYTLEESWDNWDKMYSALEAYDPNNQVFQAKQIYFYFYDDFAKEIDIQDFLRRSGSGTQKS